ncbi:hypothetical protein [Streptosporangium sp. KLBMP 9127]|nr:hypothetical protein [Streptosporangium sp. KLBMP 9127]
MTGWEAALWGLLGGAVAEALNLSACMRPVAPRRRWRWPWSNQADLPMMLVAVALRLFVGCGLASALGASGQLPTPFSAFLAGVAAPLIVAKIFQTIPVTEPADVLPPSVHAPLSMVDSRASDASK